MQEEKNDVEIETPIGIRVRGSGRSIVVLCAVLVVLIAIYLHDRHSTEAHAETIAALTKVERAENEANERTAEVVYVLSKSQSEREKLNLTMPDSLRRKMGAR